MADAIGSIGNDFSTSSKFWDDYKNSIVSDQDFSMIDATASGEEDVSADVQDFRDLQISFTQKVNDTFERQAKKDEEKKEIDDKNTKTKQDKVKENIQKISFNYDANFFSSLNVSNNELEFRQNGLQSELNNLATCAEMLTKSNVNKDKIAVVAKEFNEKVKKFNDKALSFKSDVKKDDKETNSIKYASNGIAMEPQKEAEKNTETALSSNPFYNSAINTFYSDEKEEVEVDT